MENLALAIGIGLGISLIFAELFGLAAGGMIVPGYFALFLDKPLSIIFTIAIAIATFLIVRLISTVVIVYGKRRTVLMILVGYILGFSIPLLIPGISLLTGSSEITIVGYIIPGLIAIWLDRQGMIETLSTLVIASVSVRLVLILILGEAVKV